jgi:BirA family biotin operon repressor/biotin-[acetyl-CoA-carboxylase] ligase
MTKNNDIIWLTEVDSTNKYVKSNIDSLDNLSVVSALSQTAGRGQGDHTWQSEPGQNLLFSILLKEPDVAPNCQKAISDAVAESMVKLLEKHGIEAWIKPPNDIWVRDKKICGILIEHALRSGRISWSILGVGLNVNQTVFPSDLPNPTSMALENQGGNLETILSEYLEIFKLSSFLK